MERPRITSTEEKMARISFTEMIASATTVIRAKLLIELNRENN